MVRSARDVREKRSYRSVSEKRSYRSVSERTKRAKAANDRTRRDWGEISPITKVIPDKRKKKAAEVAKREMREM